MCIVYVQIRYNKQSKNLLEFKIHTFSSEKITIYNDLHNPPNL